MRGRRGRIEREVRKGRTSQVRWEKDVGVEGQKGREDVGGGREEGELVGGGSKENNKVGVVLVRTKVREEEGEFIEGGRGGRRRGGRGGEYVGRDVKRIGRKERTGEAIGGSRRGGMGDIE